MSIVVAGQSTDFTEDPNISIMNLLKNNWPLTGAQGDPDLQLFDSATNRSGVKVGTSWWDAQTFFQVHVRPMAQVVRTKTLGAQRWQYKDFHQIHIFAKGNNAKDKRWKMEQEVMRILHLNEANPATGILYMKLRDDGPRQVPEEDTESEVEHSLLTVQLYYHKIRIP